MISRTLKNKTYTVNSVVKGEGDPWFVERHKIIKSLFASIKAYAYIPDTSDVLHDEVDHMRGRRRRTNLKVNPE